MSDWQQFFGGSGGARLSPVPLGMARQALLAARRGSIPAFKSGAATRYFNVAGTIPRLSDEFGNSLAQCDTAYAAGWSPASGSNVCPYYDPNDGALYFIQKGTSNSRLVRFNDDGTHAAVGGDIANANFAVTNWGGAAGHSGTERVGNELHIYFGSKRTVLNITTGALISGNQYFGVFARGTNEQKAAESGGLACYVTADRRVSVSQFSGAAAATGDQLFAENLTSAQHGRVGTPIISPSPIPLRPLNGKFFVILIGQSHVWLAEDVEQVEIRSGVLLLREDFDSMLRDIVKMAIGAEA